MKILLFPWYWYQSMVHGFLAGALSWWVALLSACALLVLLFLLSFVLARILRCSSSSRLPVVISFIVGGIMLAAAVYPWFLGAYTWRPVFVRLVWSWLFGAGGMWLGLMVAMVGSRDCHY